MNTILNFRHFYEHHGIVPKISNFHFVHLRLALMHSGYSNPGVQQPVKQIHHQIYQDEQKADHQD